MKKPACVLFLVLLGASLAAAQILRTPYGMAGPNGILHLPFQVTTPDGVLLTAGDYSTWVQESGLKYVGRAPASLGRWPGPSIHLWPRDPLLPLPLARFTLKTEVEVYVIYDIPHEAERRQQIRSAAGEVAPLIRNHRELVGIVYRGDILYITEARRGISLR